MTNTQDDITVTETFTPTCGICGQSVHEQFFACPSCGAMHHQDCWEFNEGCSAFGCNKAGSKKAAKPKSTGASLIVQRNENGLIVREQSRQTKGWFSIITGMAALTLLAGGTPLAFHSLFMFSVCLVIGLKFLHQKLEVLPGAIRIGGFMKWKTYSAEEVSVERIDWMKAIIITSKEGEQLLILKGSQKELDRVSELLEGTAGIFIN